MTKPSGELVTDTQIIDGQTVDRIPHHLTTSSIGRLRTRNAASKRKPYFNSLVYGDSGVGKTLLVASAAMVPEMCPILFLDFEEGGAVFDHLGDDVLANMEVLPGDDADPLKWSDVQAIYDYLWTGKHPFKTVIMDTASEAQVTNLAYLLGYEGKVDLDAKLPKFEEWNETTAQMRRMFRGFRDLRMNTIFTAHTYMEEHPSSTPQHKRFYVKPDFIGTKLRAEAPAFFNIVLYMFAKRAGSVNERHVMTDSDGIFTAKNRIPGAPRDILNPTMEGLYDMMVRNRQPSTLDLSGAKITTVGAPAGTEGRASGRMARKA